jgi:hypothetical protein
MQPESWTEIPPVELEPQDSPGHPLAPWFGTVRRKRREHYRSRPRGRAPRRAVITMVHNEPVFFTIWLRYYSRFFAPKDIYVLDHESTDGATDRDGFVRIPVEHPTVDHEWMVDTIAQLQHELLGRYEVTLVTDVDEIVAPVPQNGTLGEYLDRFDEEWVNCLGYELLHQQRSEPPLDLDRPVLDQRGFWFFNDGYDKAALATVPMDWRPGFHGRSDFEFNLDPDLRLIHLHRMDFDLCRERHRIRAQRRWAERDAREGWAEHNRITDEATLRDWFFEHGSFEGFEITLEAIPPEWRGVF